MATLASSSGPPSASMQLAMMRTARSAVGWPRCSSISTRMTGYGGPVAERRVHGVRDVVVGVDGALAGDGRPREVRAAALGAHRAGRVAHEVAVGARLQVQRAGSCLLEILDVRPVVLGNSDLKPVVLRHICPLRHPVGTALRDCCASLAGCSTSTRRRATARAFGLPVRIGCRVTVGVGTLIDAPEGHRASRRIAGRLAQLVRALASHARGHWFKSSTAHHTGPPGKTFAGTA